MATSWTTLPDGRQICCVNAYEVGFGWHEVVSEDLSQNGLNLPTDCICFDVGANIGLFSLRLLDLCPGAQILAFEPMPAAFEALQANFTGLGGRAEAVKLALGARQGTAEFAHYPALSALSTGDAVVGEKLVSGLRNLLSKPGASEEIRTIIDRSGAHDRLDDEAFMERLFLKETVGVDVDTLDNVVRRHSVETIDLLKIDTEGQERAVLDGIGAALWLKIRQLVVEVHRGRDELVSLRSELEERGYKTVVKDHPMAQGGAPVFHLYAHRPEMRRA
jgi:FkbM family methyltransferase